VSLINHLEFTLDVRHGEHTEAIMGMENTEDERMWSWPSPTSRVVIPGVRRPFGGQIYFTVVTFHTVGSQRGSEQSEVALHATTLGANGNNCGRMRE
jgi:hypothetical protein